MDRALFSATVQPAQKMSLDLHDRASYLRWHERACRDRAGPGVLVRRRPSCHPVRPVLGAGPRRAGRGQPALHERRARADRFHLRADERHPGSLAPGDHGHRPGGRRQPGPSVQRHALAPGRRPLAAPRGKPAGPADQGAVAHDGLGVQRSRAPAREAGHRRSRDRRLLPLLARDDARLRQRDVQRRPQGLRPGRAGQLRAADAGHVPPRHRDRRRSAGLAPPARPRLPAHRRPVHGWARGLHRRADLVQRRRPRPAPGLPRARCASTATRAGCC